MDQLSFDTTEFPVSERFDRWRAGIGDFVVEELDKARPFDGRSVVTGLGALLISESKLPPLRFARTPAMIRSKPRDHWNLTLMFEGVMEGVADGRPFHVAAGTPLLLDLSRPAEVIASRGRSIVIVLPRNLLGAGRRTDAHGPLEPSAETRLLADYLVGLSGALPNLQAAAALPAGRALCELLAACLPPVADRRQIQLMRVQALRSSLLAYVEAHLEEPLSVGRLCAALAVSRSALYRAVEADGGVAGLIKIARLEWAHRVLSDRTDDRTIHQIAGAAGFRDDTIFSRQFREAFGYTAAELRRNGVVPSALPRLSEDPAVTFRDAVDRLAAGPNAG